MRKGIGSHQSAKSGKDEWLTPPEIIKSLGEFDLDPCAPIVRPWDTAKKHYTIKDDGLVSPWNGRVWCNPPYGLEAKKWLSRAANHSNAIALVFARTETKMFFSNVWPKAKSIFFFEGRLFFYHVDGTIANANAGAPSVLISYNDENSDAIEESGLQGHHQPVGYKYVVVCIDRPKKTWRVTVNDVLSRFPEGTDLTTIYEKVVISSPSKIRNNKNYKAKIRQTLQYYFDKVEDKWKINDE